MKIYIAGRYGRRKELLDLAFILRKKGHDVTSRWLLGEPEGMDRDYTPELAQWLAEVDFADIDAADALLAFTEAGEAPGASRGGRHVEMGYALRAGKRVMVVGPAENMFCHHSRVRVFATLDDLWREVSDDVPF